MFSLVSDDDIKKLDIDQIKKIIAPKMEGLTISTPIIHHGSFLYRARKLNDLFHKNKKISISELSYPFANIASIGGSRRMPRECSHGSKMILPVASHGVSKRSMLV